MGQFILGHVLPLLLLVLIGILSYIMIRSIKKDKNGWYSSLKAKYAPKKRTIAMMATIIYLVSMVFAIYHIYSTVLYYIAVNTPQHSHTSMPDMPMLVLFGIVIVALFWNTYECGDCNKKIKVPMPNKNSRWSLKNIIPWPPKQCPHCEAVLPN